MAKPRQGQKSRATTLPENIDRTTAQPHAAYAAGPRTRSADACSLSPLSNSPSLSFSLSPLSLSLSLRSFRNATPSRAHAPPIVSSERVPLIVEEKRRKERGRGRREHKPRDPQGAAVVARESNRGQHARGSLSHRHAA